MAAFTVVARGSFVLDVGGMTVFTTPAFSVVITWATAIVMPIIVAAAHKREGGLQYFSEPFTSSLEVIVLQERLTS